MSKKVLVFSLFAILFLGSFVSAADFVNTVKDAADSAWQLIKPLAEFLLGASTDPSVFMARIILFIILLSLVYFAVKQFPAFGDNTTLVWIISLGVSILGVRFMAESWVTTVILPYSALGIALTALFPLIVYFFFVERGLATYPTLRKFAWIFAAVVFGVLFFVRSGEIAAPAEGFDPAYVYLIAAAACVLFLLLDRTIQKWYARVRNESYTSVHAQGLETHYRRLIQQAYDDRRNNVIDQPTLERLVKKYQKELERVPGR